MSTESKTQNDGAKEREARVHAACQRALRQVCLALPHLSGLVHQVRLKVEPRAGTAGVFASGRMVVNPDFVASLAPAELLFVMAHEVLHLALDTHARGLGADPEAVNVAHDYIINDMLAHELDQEVPAGGLEYDGARHFSLEEVLSWGHRLWPRGCWGWQAPAPQLSALGEGLVDAGLAERPQSHGNPMLGDVLSASMEREWYPDAGAAEIAGRTRSVKAAAAKANSLQIMKEQIERAGRQDGDAIDDVWTETIDALKTAYQPPWQLALQRWFDAGAPAERSYARPSRRAGDRRDIVLPGRRRVGRTMHIVLDTSGSMTEELTLALGIIAGFCAANDVQDVHMLQCDETVTVDEWVSIDALDHYQVRGYGGSDMSPAMLRLAEDPSVEAAIVLTDGFLIGFPEQQMPYEVLWALVGHWWDGGFDPSYGVVVPVPVDRIKS